jgi:guanylate kinase
MKSLQQLASEEKTYLPSSVVREQLSHVPLVCVVGGVGVGKNYLMQRTGLPIVGRVTPRAKRPDDNPAVYTYYANEEFTGMIERQELVQYAVDLRNDAIYGSTPENYVIDTPNLADIWHWSVADLPEKGFQSVRAISIITPVEQWRGQLETRFTGRDKAFQRARLAEAKESLVWTRAQIAKNNPNHAVIINDKDSTDISVNTMTDFANGGAVKIPENATALIEQMLDFLETAPVAL